MMFNKRAGLAALFALITLSSPLTTFAQVATSTTSLQVTTPATSTVATSSVQTIIDPFNTVDVEAAVKNYFADIPVMAAIAKCESNFRQYDSSGSVLNGGSGGMIGVFQINKAVHKTFALSLGDDIATLAGNMAYARYLYTQEGTDPWISSEGCWGSVVSSGALPAAASSTLGVIKSVVTPTVAQASTTHTKVSTGKTAGSNLTLNLKVGTVSPQVATLQQLLNSAGYKVAKSGAGSPGQETQKFGAATLAAVQRFQCARNIACKGTVATTGYGYVGAKTRAALIGALAIAQ